MSDGRARLTTDEALSRLKVLPDYDPGTGPGPCVHTVRDAGVARLGAHHELESLRERFDRFGAEEAGPRATADGYGVVVIDETGPLFCETGRTGDAKGA